MLVQPQAITPVIVQQVPPPTQEVSVVDVIVGAMGLTGLFAIGAVIAGIAFGILLIRFKRWRERSAPSNEPSATRLDLSSH
jgi:hypothetical protein